MDLGMEHGARLQSQRPTWCIMRNTYGEQPRSLVVIKAVGGEIACASPWRVQQGRRCSPWKYRVSRVEREAVLHVAGRVEYIMHTRVCHMSDKGEVSCRCLLALVALASLGSCAYACNEATCPTVRANLCLLCTTSMTTCTTV